MSFDTDPHESAQVSGADFAMMCDEIKRLRAFIESIVDVNGPYPELHGKPIIADAYAALNPVAKKTGPRYFIESSTDMMWKWENEVMLTSEGETSIFTSPEELLGCLDVIETDADGEPLECDHEWEHRDDSFDHEFGTEKIPPYEKCLLCEAVREFEDHRSYDE